MTRQDVQIAISHSLKELREQLNLSKAKMAEKLKMAENTWRSYESGESIPRSDDFLLMFIESGVNPEKAVMKAMYPEKYSSSLSDQDKREALIDYLQHSAPENVINILYFLRFGPTGSDFEALLNKQCMENHTPMRDRVRSTKITVNDYVTAEHLGELLYTDWQMPDVQLVVNALAQGQEAVYNRRDAYSVHKETPVEDVL